MRGIEVILMNGLISSENFGNTFGNKLSFRDGNVMLGFPLLANSAIKFVKIFSTRSFSSFNSSIQCDGSPIILFSLKMYPRSSP